ncbi:helix-turn-helix domain-containing protein [Streptococcus pluranimalium]
MKYDKKKGGKIMSLGNKQIMAENIKRLLDKKGLNPRQMAIALDFKYTTVLDWVNAKTYPRIDKVEMMANFFNVAKSDLVEEYDPNKTSRADDNLENRIKEYYINIKSDRKSTGHVFNEKAFENAALAWRSVPYLDLDQYTFELILNSNTNNLQQVNDKKTLIAHFENSVKNLKIGQEDSRVPREVQEYLGVLSKQHENYLLAIENKD